MEIHSAALNTRSRETMAHLGLLAVWLLLISQSDCGWIDIPKVNDILHDFPDINVHEIVNEAEDAVKGLH